MKLFTCWDSPFLHFAGQGKRFTIKEVPDGRDAVQIKNIASLDVLEKRKIEPRFVGPRS
jgi:hypothetical protein